MDTGARGKRGGSKCNLRDEAYETLKRMIVTDQLQAGQFTSLQELIEKVGLGRSPVRDAVLKLDDERLLRIIPRKGILICGLRSRDLTEIFEIRLAIECFAIDKVILLNKNSEKIAMFETILETQVKLLETKDEEKFCTEDERFHMEIIYFLDNERINRIINDCRNQLICFGFKGLTSHYQITSAIDEHRHILEAIKAGNSKRAKELLTKHLWRTKDSILV